MKKRFISFFVCLILVCMVAIPASAASDTTTISNRLSQISKMSGYTAGSVKSSGYCWKFVNEVSKQLFAVGIPTGTGGHYYLTGANNNKDWYLVGSSYGTNATNTAVVDVLKKAQAGDIIQYSNAATGKSSQHTAMIYAVSDSDISIYESTKTSKGATHQNVRQYTCTWDTITNWSWEKGLGTFGGVDGYGISLYRCNKSVKTDVKKEDAESNGGTNVTITVKPGDATSAAVTTGACDNLTQTGATLRGSFTTTGARASECGMYIGIFKDNLKKLGSDKVNTYGTSMYYSTSKYGYTLEPGRTYYYQAYVIANSKTYTGEVENFTTPGDTTAGSIVLDRTSLTLKNGVCTQLTATTTPAGQKVTWTSSDTSVATVSSSGEIDTRKVGTTTITAKMTYNNTTYSAACKVTVAEYPQAAVTTKGADNISQTSAIVHGEVTVSSGTVTECGMYIGKSASSLSKLGSDSISRGTPFYYSTSKYGYSLTAGTTYYYQAYAIVDGKTFWGDVESFETGKTAAAVTTKGADNITQTSAIVRGEVTVSSGTVTECGMYIGASTSNLTKLGSDSISKGTPFYYSTSKYGYALTAGTTYYYQSYAIVDGKTIWGDVKSFTTAAVTVSATTRTATVVNTNGQYLAINNAPAASPNYSTQIGRIPPGGTVTVDTSKTSGSWYWVTYNGVSGYAYGKYLSLN